MASSGKSEAVRKSHVLPNVCIMLKRITINLPSGMAKNERYINAVSKPTTVVLAFKNSA